MPQDQLEAEAATLDELFAGEKELHAPIFQRLYVWGASEAEKLWDDIDQVLDGQDAARFLGAVVLQDRTSKVAFAPRAYWIIDGQQRLTTLYLLLLAIADASRRAGDHDFATLLVDSYLLNQHGSANGQTKVRPTNRDLAQFSKLVDKIGWANPLAPLGFGEESGAMTRMFAILSKELADRVKLNGPGYRTDVAKALLENLKFVRIILSPDDDPHQVFDSLNNRGQRLETIDLVRNEVFQRFGTDYDGAENLYNSRWRSFEDSLQGRLGDYFFPYTLIKKSTTTKSKLFTVLKSEWESKSPQEVLDDLVEYVPAYKAIAMSEPLEVSSELSLAIERLRRMPAPAVVYPFTIRVIHAALKGNLPQDVAAANLRLVESFLVRRALAGYEPTGLHAVFKGLWNTTGGEPQRLIDVIDHNPTIEFPSDDRFVQDIATRQLDSRKLCKYVLWEYERGLLDGDPVPLGSDLIIDHVAPKTPTPEWLEAFGPREIYNSLVHTWANLTPLSNPLNAQKQRVNWTATQALFRTETAFKTTKRLADRWVVWDAASVAQRSNELAAWAVERWPKLA